jgi:hypothetical protein
MLPCASDAYVSVTAPVIVRVSRLLRAAGSRRLGSSYSYVVAQPPSVTWCPRLRMLPTSSYE